MSGWRAAGWSILAPLVFLLLWSGGFTVAKIGVQYAEPMTLLALRYACALAVLAPLALWLKPPLPCRPVEWLHIAAVGFLIHAVYFGLNYLAFALGVAAGTVALITSLQPILVALLAGRIVDERVGAVRWLGLILGLAGSACVILAQSAVDVAAVAGMAAAVGALLGMTAATLYEKRFGVGHHPVAANAVQYAVGLAATLPLAFAFEDMTVAWTAAFAGALAYLVIGNSLISITLLLAMIRRGKAARVSSLLFLVPPTAAVIAWAAIDEDLAPLAWLGLAVAAAGVAIVVRPPALARRTGG
jgi:drug/metabolite transporter (DMT)-like permease